MSEYEEMSEKMNEAKKNMITKNQGEQDPPEQKESDYTFAGFMGIVFIIIGVVGAIGIMLSFDWDTYNNLKDRSSLYAEELALLKSDLTSTWVMAIATLIGNLAIGSVLLALDKIIRLLKRQ